MGTTWYQSKPPPIFYLSNDFDRILFNSDNTPRTEKDNTEAYPLYLNKNLFYILNPHSGTNAEDADGQFPGGWDPNSRNTQINTDKINNFPRQMMRNLILIAGKDGVPIPVAGSYFTKLLSATPGTIQANSALIVGPNNQINELTITGNLNLSGSNDALNAINTFGKTNTIDCGYINDLEE